MQHFLIITSRILDVTTIIFFSSSACLISNDRELFLWRISIKWHFSSVRIETTLMSFACRSLGNVQSYVAALIYLLQMICRKSIILVNLTATEESSRRTWRPATNVLSICPIKFCSWCVDLVLRHLLGSTLRGLQSKKIWDNYGGGWVGGSMSR